LSDVAKSFASGDIIFETKKGGKRVFLLKIRGSLSASATFLSITVINEIAIYRDRSNTFTVACTFAIYIARKLLRLELWSFKFQECKYIKLENFLNLVEALFPSVIIMKASMILTRGALTPVFIFDLIKTAGFREPTYPALEKALFGKAVTRPEYGERFHR
jgi:hypothetical protein